MTYTRGIGYSGGIGGIISQKRGANTNYYHYDGLPSVVQLTDSNSSSVQTYTYDAYGNVLSSSGSITSPYRFSTKEYSSNAKLLYFGARYYSPKIGRWLNPDPAGMVDGPNVYLYVGNNPVNLVDPEGLCLEKSWDAWSDFVAPDFNDSASFGKEFWQGVYEDQPSIGASLTIKHVTYSVSTTGHGLSLSTTALGASIDLQSQKVSDTVIETGAFGRHTGVGAVFDSSGRPQAMTVHIGVSTPGAPVYLSAPLTSSDW